MDLEKRSDLTAVALYELLSVIADKELYQDSFIHYPGILQHLIQELASRTPVQRLAMRAIGSLLSGSDEMTEDLLNLGVLPLLVPLLRHKNADIRSETFWCISNLCGGTPDQVAQCVKADVFETLLEFYEESFDQASWCVVNAATGSSVEDFAYLVGLPTFFHRLCELLADHPIGMLPTLCDALLRAVTYGSVIATLSQDSTNPYMGAIMPFEAQLATAVHSCDPAAQLYALCFQVGSNSAEVIQNVYV